MAEVASPSAWARFDAKALGTLWDDALRSGEIPGAYRAVVTHRAVPRYARGGRWVKQVARIGVVDLRSRRMGTSENRSH